MNLTISDPVTALATAALNAFAEYMKFLCTEEGQKFSADARALTWDRLVKLLPDGSPAKPPA